MSDERPPRIGDEVPLYRPGGTGEADHPADQGDWQSARETGSGAGAPPPRTPSGVTPPDERPVPTAAVDERQDAFRERLVASVFLAGAAAAIGFFVMFAIHAGPTTSWINVWLGLLLGVALIALGSGAVLWAKLLMPHEEAVEERHPFNSAAEAQQSAAESFNAGVAGSGIARRPLLRRSLGFAGLVVVVLPLLNVVRSLGPRPKGELAKTNWAEGSRVVDQFNNPVMLGDIELNGFATVFPEGHTGPEDAAADTVMLLRIDPALVRDKNRAKSYQGHLAYSKICTHAGCPASLYDQQTYTLLCPCHQSQFKVLEDCKPVAGPATRALPQLGITVDSDGYFRATGPFDQPIGPGFWERKS